MDDDIFKIKKKLEEINQRNRRVEAEKAWETSWFRMISIMLITYLLAAIVLFLIGAENIFRNALIPTIGYFLSAQSLPVVKKWWIKRWYK